MTQHQYNIVKWLRRVWFLKRLFGKDEARDIVTKQAEIELAGQSAARRGLPHMMDDAGKQGIAFEMKEGERSDGGEAIGREMKGVC